jgi:methylmalonyl-CoA mutase
MANTKREKLFAEFPAVSTEKWEEVITADLKGADYERKLVWRTGEGFNVRPYYRAANLEGLRFLASQPGEFPYVRGTRNDNVWRVHQTITVKCPKAANEEALQLLNSGVDSIGFYLTKALDAAEVDTLLNEIYLPAVEVVIAGAGVGDVAELVLAKIEKEGLKESANVCFVIDPIILKLSLKGKFCSENGAKCFNRLATLARKSADMKGVRVVTVSGETFSNAGSTIVEELAFTLSAGHDYLVRLMDEGLTVDEAALKIRFSLGVSSNYFMEMAKFRAARMLWANIVKGYNPEKSCSYKMYTHAVTSTWNQTVYDPYINMLRGTTEAMSAAIAGVHSLEVTPFNTSFAEPNEFSKRIARNVELLLKHESHFDQVVDPAGGSYYIENLTQSIAAEAWKLFLDLEERGGYIEAFKSGYVVERVEASAATKDKSVSQRKITLLGANQYPNFTETISEEVDAAAVTRANNAGVLNPYRGAMAFEAMRMHVDRSGKSPKAFMLTTGHLAMARARAQFSCNFFACAGIRVQDNTFFKSLEEGAQAALDSKAEIVVLCSSDDCYAELAPKAKELLGDKAILVVAGAPACMAELEAQGIHNFIHVKSNVLDTLHNYLTQMGI